MRFDGFDDIEAPQNEYVVNVDVAQTVEYMKGRMAQIIAEHPPLPTALIDLLKDILWEEAKVNGAAPIYTPE